MVYEITKTAAKFGFSYSESNPELETNKKSKMSGNYLNQGVTKEEESIINRFNKEKKVNQFKTLFCSRHIL